MFKYLNNLYQRIRESYRDHKENKKHGHVTSFFLSIFDYISGKGTNHFTLSNSQQGNFKRGLDSRLRDDYDISYKPGEIVLKRKNLAEMVS